MGPMKEDFQKNYLSNNNTNIIHSWKKYNINPTHIYFVVTIWKYTSQMLSTGCQGQMTVIQSTLFKFFDSQFPHLQ